MNALDTNCVRCAQGGIVLATNIRCPSCGKDNSNKRHAFVYCHELLGVPLTNIQRQSLNDYQKKSSEYAQIGDLVRSLATLREAIDFYPDDVKTRTVLIGVLERMGKIQEAGDNRNYLHLLRVRDSVELAVQQGNMAFGSGNFHGAIQNFEIGLRYHPQSVALHEGLAASLDCIGDTNRAHTERAIAAQLRSHQQTRRDQSAHSAETAGMVAGTAIGATGAAVGGAITVVSVISGILIALVGVALCIIAVLLFMTCIGFPLAILAMLAGFGIIATGFTVAMGGAAAGAGTGFLGIFTGALTSGTAAIHRNSRKK